MPSPDGVDERLVVVGELVGVHGLRGELRVRPFNPDTTSLAEVAEVFLLEPEPRAATVQRARPHGNVWLLQLDVADTPQAARSLVGQKLAVREEDLSPLGEGEFYHYQLIGLEVESDSGESLGRVTNVISARGNDVIAIDCGGRERLVPLVAEIVRKIDLEAGRVTIRPIAGLLDD